MHRHVDNTLKTPSDSDLKAVFEVMQTDQPFEKVKDNLKEQIMDRRRDKARKAYVESLRKQENAQVILDSPSAKVATTGAPSLGPANAPVKIIEFADYQCPYCKQVHPDLQRLREEFPQQTVLVYEDFPLPMHPFAEKAAEASHCAEDQGKFWEYHDGLFQHNGPLDAEALKGIARSLNLDQAKFTQCLDSGKEAPTVAKGLAEGKKLGLTGTPTFFINGHMAAGATKYDALKELVTHQLSSESSDQKSGG
jgi:protein-disulfide isomerase